MFHNILKKCSSIGLGTVFIGCPLVNVANVAFAQGERENAVKSLKEQIKISLKKDISEDEIKKAITEIKSKEILEKIYKDQDYRVHVVNMLFANIEEQRQKVFSYRKVFLCRDYFKTKSGLNCLSGKRLELREILVKEMIEYKVKEAQEKVDIWIWTIPEKYCTGLCDNTLGDVDIDDVAWDLIEIYEINNCKSDKTVDNNENSDTSIEKGSKYNFDSID